MSEFLPYCRPTIDDADVAAVSEALKNGWLTTGPKVLELQEAFVTLSRIKHAVAVNSCTAAMKLALVALGVGPGDEVIMPALTFVAGAECVRQLGAEPVFCDVDPETLCVTTRTVREAVSPRSKAIIVMHYGGQPADAHDIVDWAAGREIAVIEDAAHALGTLEEGNWPGAVSDAAAFSFYPTKNITSAEGGVLLTNRDDIAEKASILSLHGMDRDAWKRYEKGGGWRYDVVATGFKFNMPDLLAVLALSQLKKLERLQQAREKLAERYLRGLKTLSGIRPVTLPASPPDRHSWCLFAIAVDRVNGGPTRDQIIEALKARNIGVSVHFIPTHLFSAYRNARRTDLSVTEDLWERLISLPLYPSMTEGDVDRVLDALASSLGRTNIGQASRAGCHP
jgi:perosamine synthetase